VHKTPTSVVFVFITAEQNDADSIDPRKVHRKSAGFIIGEWPATVVFVG